MGGAVIERGGGGCEGLYGRGANEGGGGWFIEYAGMPGGGPGGGGG